MLEIFKPYTSNASTNGGTEFIGVARLVEKAGIVVLVLPLLVGSLTIIFNSVQLWTLKKKFRRELNSLFVILRHLCVADLLNGVVTLTQTLVSVIEWKFLPKNNFLLWLTEFIGLTCNKYVFSVSTVLLNCLTLLKMIIVTRNCWYTRATVGKICKSVWIVTLVINSIEYGISKSEIFSSDIKVVLRRVMAPLITLVSFIFQSYCFGKIFCRRRIVNSRVPPRADRQNRSDGMFLKIAIFQILSYMLCIGPLSTYLALPLFGDFKVEKRLITLFGSLAYLNSIIDPIIFFVVYRRKWRRRQPVPPIQQIRLSYVIKGSSG